MTGRVVDDATLAVTAHSLLTAMTVIHGSLELVRERWQDLTEAQRDDLLVAASRRSEGVTVVLRELARGLPPSCAAVLDDGEAHGPAAS